MRFRLEQRFAAPLVAVEQAFFDHDALKRLEAPSRFGRMELLDQSRGASDDGIVTQRVRYHFSGHLSGAVTAVVDPSRLTWVEEMVYDRRSHRGDITIVPDHYPDRLACTAVISFEEASGSTRREREGDLSVRVAFVAGRVERAIVAGLQEHAALEEQIVQQWLDEQTARSG